MKRLISFLLVLMTVVGCAQVKNPEGVEFKTEYESLNGEKNSNGKEYVPIELPKENPMVYATADEIVEALDGDAIIYFGFSSCPWCRNALPVLIDAAKEKEVEKILYFDIKEERDQLELQEDGSIKEIKPKGEGYQKIYDKLYDSLEVYEGLNDDSIKRIYAPTVIFVRGGKVVKYHVSTVESQVDASVPMTDEQKQELRNIYLDGIHAIQKQACDIKC